jgi:hypothetical protein
VENHPAVSIIAKNVVIVNVRCAVKMILSKLRQDICVTMISSRHNNKVTSSWRSFALLFPSYVSAILGVFWGTLKVCNTVSSMESHRSSLVVEIFSNDVFIIPSRVVTINNRFS